MQSISAPAQWPSATCLLYTSYELAGLCLDTGHLYYSGMDPVEWLKKYAGRLDYVHFKDVSEKVYRDVLNKKIRFFEGCGEGAMLSLIHI